MCRLLFCCLFIHTGILSSLAQTPWQSEFVRISPGGKISYTPDSPGNTIPDFSGVGYFSQKRNIPVVPTIITVSPEQQPQQQTIQNAIDSLAKLPLNEHGFRGAVLLKKGTYHIPGTIRISVSGIVLRGEGEATKLIAAGKEQRNLVSIRGTGERKEIPGTTRKITDAFVPTGARSFHVSSTEGLKEDDAIILFRPGTREWISAIQMDRIHQRDASIQQWNPKEYDLHFERKITRIEGNRIHIDHPVIMQMEEKFGGGAVFRYDFEGRINNVGVENLVCQSEFTDPEDEDHAWTAIYFNEVENGWVQYVNSYHFGYACVNLGHLSRYITVQHCGSFSPKSIVTGGRRYSFNNDGQCNLVQYCYASEGRHDFVTGARVCGPNVFFHCRSENAKADIGPHHRWTVGTLYDNIITDGEINVQDRGDWGTGHGWAGVTQVLWNCTAEKAAVQSPWASGYNYNIGFMGDQYEGRLKGRPVGIWEGRNQPGLTPSSLFTAQRKEKVKKDSIWETATTTLRTQVLKDAEWALQQAPVTITAHRAERSAGGLHDFFSEGDYWWPDPENPEGPYIQKDGLSNPENFTAHREAMIRFSKIMGSLASAYLLHPDEKYVYNAIEHAKAWFTDSATYMRPSLLYAQAIKGRVTGRGIGIIDAIQLMEVAQSLYVLRSAPSMDIAVYKSFRNWFAAYLGWLRSHPYGIAEMNAKNNHGTCWVMQAAVFARFTGNNEMIRFCSERFKKVLLPTQMAENGSFPLELKRTKLYGYSIFNLDAMATICQTISGAEDNLWGYSINGKNMKKAISFLYPFIADKNTWPYPKDVMYWEEWPVAQPFLLFGAAAFRNKKWLNTWRQLEHDPDENEVIRNLPIRHPLIWQ